MESIDALNLVLFGAGTLVVVSVMAGLYSVRVGFSFLVVFLTVGMLAGEDGVGGIAFDDFRLALWVGTTALAVILLDGGLRTRLSTFRTALVPAVWLATVGVVVTAALTGLAAMLLFDLPLALGLLVGSIVGSTDAAAVFALMRSAGLRVSERLSATLEIESGLNDPMAVFLVLALISFATAPETTAPIDLLWLLVQQGAVGLLSALLAGRAVAAVLNRLPLAEDQEGLGALLLLGSGLATFAGTGWLGGSGFLAVYLFGLVVADRAPLVVQRSLAAMDGFAWLSQAGVFLLLGLLVTPHRLLDTLLPALGVAAVLMFVARPLAVALCLAPMRFTRSEIGFVSWVGLRGAVPAVLAVFPLMAGVPEARSFFDVAFVVVLASLILQGSTLVHAARWFRVNLPDAQDEPATRAVFGDFALDGAAPLAEVFGFYGLRVPEDAQGRTLSAWLEHRLDRPAVVGDAVSWGGARLAVRAMRDGHVHRVGLVLADPAEPVSGR